MDLASLEEIFRTRLPVEVIKRVFDAHPGDQALEELLQLAEWQETIQTPDTQISDTGEGKERAADDSEGRTIEGALKNGVCQTLSGASIALRNCALAASPPVTMESKEGAQPLSSLFTSKDHCGEQSIALSLQCGPDLPNIAGLLLENCHTCQVCPSQGKLLNTRLPAPSFLVSLPNEKMGISRRYWQKWGASGPEGKLVQTAKSSRHVNTVMNAPVGSPGVAYDFLDTLLPGSLPACSGSQKVKAQPTADSLPSHLTDFSDLHSPNSSPAACTAILPQVYTPPIKLPPSRSPNRSPPPELLPAAMQQHSRPASPPQIGPAQQANMQSSDGHPAAFHNGGWDASPRAQRWPMSMVVAQPFRPSASIDDRSSKVRAGSAHSSRASSETSSEEGPAEARQQAGSAVAILTEMFTDLSYLVPDVLQACDNEPSKAYEELQRIQDQAQDATFDWDKSDDGSTDEAALQPERLAELMAQFHDLPKQAIEDALQQHDNNLDQACIALTMLRDEQEDERMATDRALANELSQGTCSNTPVTMVEGREWTSDGSDTRFEMLDAATKNKLQYLGSCFPKTSLPALLSCLEVTDGNVDVAKEVLRDNNAEEVTDRSLALGPPNPSASTPNAGNFLSRWPGVSSAARSDVPSPPPPPPPRDHRPRHAGGSRSNQNQIYLEQRAVAHKYSEDIGAGIQRMEELKKQGKHHEAAVIDGMVHELIKKKREEEQLASRRIFEEVNEMNFSIKKVDLHGQHKHEAVSILHKSVEHALDDVCDTRYEVVTGRGNNSKDNIPVVKQAVLAYLTQRGIVHAIQPGNAGVVIFRIAARQRLRPYDGVVI